uniref:RNA polymerase II transcription factor B subunit 2 n=1 Tax=Glycine max TaxID=3847 RepID=A0A0R0HU75_SOYBN
MSARSAVTRISKSERTSWFTEDSTERNDCQSTAAATPVCFAWWKIRSKEFAALRTARSAPSCRGFVPLSLRYNFLMCQYRDKEAPKLTESGFQFLLMDTNAQLWYIIREYISNSEVALTFFLMIFFPFVF